MRDENGFKCHTQTEGHVRNIMLVGENSQKFINDYSNQFLKDFMLLLRTSHGEKKISLNHFYQEYIHNKEHIHMNATKWPSLTELGKHLGREGICRVEEGDKGLEIAWIDNSPEALRRQDAIRKKERQDKGDEEREQKLIAEQIERARQDAEDKMDKEGGLEARLLQREDGEKIKLHFGSKIDNLDKPLPSPLRLESKGISPPAEEQVADTFLSVATSSGDLTPVVPEKVAIKFGSNKPKNVFAAASKKNAFGVAKLAAKAVPAKPMSEAERIMKDEIERKRLRGDAGFGGLGTKRIKLR